MAFTRIPHPNQYNTLGLAYTDKYHVYAWQPPQKKQHPQNPQNTQNPQNLKKPPRLLFSVCKQGEALMCHFAANASGLRFIRQAINEFYHFLREHYQHRMILAYVLKPSVMRLFERMPDHCTAILETPQGRIYRFHF